MPLHYADLVAEIFTWANTSGLHMTWTAVYLASLDGRRKRTAVPLVPTTAWHINFANVVMSKQP